MVLGHCWRNQSLEGGLTRLRGSTLIYIRHMVCVKCILVVRELLVELGLVPLRVELGEVEVAGAAEAID